MRTSAETIPNTTLYTRRVCGTAHIFTRLACPCWPKDSPPRKEQSDKSTPIKNGRYGSSNVRVPIQAPVRPSATKTRGPRQQVEAKMAATPPTRRAPELVRSEPLSPISTLTWHPPASVGFLLSKLGNGRDVYAALCCNCVEPIADRAPACEGR